VELDVQRSADGVPVVIHDPTLDRTTDGRGRVDAHTAAQLAALDAGVGEGVPTLAQAAAWAAVSGAWLNVEIKAPGSEAGTLALLEAAGVLPRVVVSSFDAGVVAETGRLAPHVLRFLLTKAWDAATLPLARGVGAGGVCLGEASASPAALASLRDAVLPVIVWTVDDPGRMRALLAAGVAGIITNCPQHARRLRRAAG
jgi:glycerophosphoryl diester phosphodiesterase